MSNYQKKGYLTDDFKFFYLQDEKLPEFSYHYHEFDKIVIFLSGSSKYIIEGKTYDLQPKDIILVSRNDLHKPLIDPAFPYERIIIYAAPSFLQKHAAENADLSSCFQLTKKRQQHVLRFSPEIYEKIITPILHLQQDLAGGTFAHDLYIRLLFLEFLILLHRHIELEPALPAPSCDKKIVDMIEYINENLFQDLSVETLSQRFYLSKYYMMRKFKEETGYTLHQYITQKRLLLSRDFILQNIPLTKICFDCGFKDYSTFSRAFKSVFQCTPSAYKKRQR